jgi:hypothetical protein
MKAIPVFRSKTYHRYVLPLLLTAFASIRKGLEEDSA